MRKRNAGSCWYSLEDHNDFAVPKDLCVKGVPVLMLNFLSPSLSIPRTSRIRMLVLEAVRQTGANVPAFVDFW
jgi:hypothetical protein